MFDAGAPRLKHRLNYNALWRRGISIHDEP
jgi:hypothetical protein